MESIGEAVPPSMAAAASELARYRQDWGGLLEVLEGKGDIAARRQISTKELADYVTRERLLDCVSFQVNSVVTWLPRTTPTASACRRGSKSYPAH
jgi:hypothetical protein